MKSARLSGLALVLRLHALQPLLHRASGVMLSLPADVIDDPRQILGPETHNPVLGLPLKDLSVGPDESGLMKCDELPFSRPTHSLISSVGGMVTTRCT